MPGPLMDALHEVLKSGKSLREVTLSDITNQARIKAIASGGKKQ